MMNKLSSRVRPRPHNLRVSYTSVLIFCQLFFCPVQSIRVDLGYFHQPLISRSDNLTILKNSNIVLQLVCADNEPTEWIVNFDDIYTKYRLWPHLEWNERELRSAAGSTSTEYRALLQFEMKDGSRQEDDPVCRSVNKHTENVLVKLRPEGDEFRITKHPGSGTKPQQGGSDSQSLGCPLTLQVAQVGNGYHWRCNATATASPQPPKLQFIGCRSAARCANTFRTHRAPPRCVSRVNVGAADVASDAWYSTPMDYSTGVVLCELPNPNNGAGEPERTAVEIFYEAERGTVPRKLYFSTTRVDKKDLIWFSPAISQDTYYTKEKLDTTCFMPQYGFSRTPSIIVSRNGSEIVYDRNFNIDNWSVWSKDLSLDFEVQGPGNYEITCSGPVWNSTESVNYTATLVVKDVLPPRLKSNQQNVDVTFKDGDKNQRLICDVTGDPLPTQVTWSHSGLPTILVEGNVLTLLRVSAQSDNGSLVRCNAKNQFEQMISKSFHILVEKRSGDAGESEDDGSTDGQLSTTSIFIIVGALFLTAFLAVGLVFLYCKFLKLDRTVNTFLTEKDVIEFHEGKKPNYVNQNMATVTEGIQIDALPYNSKFEILKENFIVDFNVQLGSGEYGLVYRGQVKFKTAAGAAAAAVAVKTVRDNVAVEYFKVLLSELKILAYIGSHENIANLIGAYSANIRNRELYVGVELCKTSLLGFLRGNKASFEKSWSIPDLIRWAAEVGCGMEFLASKRVVHGDLAARNVLLSFDLIAKISDFGLARQLIDYNYIKSATCPLPWKWMALESLSQMQFSTKSDVWAYGVTLWELFSLGEVPYPGMNWTMDFVAQLRSGLRMTQPKYASDSIFNVMVQCWTEDPHDRPTFSQLRTFFSSLPTKGLAQKLCG